MLNICCFEKSDFENKIFWYEGFFFMTFDFENGYKKEFQDNNEKSSSCSRNRVSLKIDFKAVWPSNGHAASMGVNDSWLIV